MARYVLCLALCSLLSASHAYAQAGQNRVEHVQNRQGLRQDVHERGDDRRDLREIEGILNRFETARVRRSVPMLDAVDRDLQRYLAAELAEGRAEMVKTEVEAAHSHQEVHAERRDLQRDRAIAAPPVARADDRHDIRKDSRDLADDRRDAAAERQEQRTRRIIARELTSLFARHDRQSLARKRVLIVELIDLARMELTRDAAEQVEDRRELREDQRERIEDRLRP